MSAAGGGPLFRIEGFLEGWLNVVDISVGCILVVVSIESSMNVLLVLFLNGVRIVGGFGE